MRDPLDNFTDAVPGWPDAPMSPLQILRASALPRMGIVETIEALRDWHDGDPSGLELTFVGGVAHYCFHRDFACEALPKTKTPGADLQAIWPTYRAPEETT